MGSNLLVLGTTVEKGEDPYWCPIPHTLAYRGGNPDKYAFQDDPAYPLSQEDIDELLSLGFIDGEKI